jgi:hypothetical protein
MSQTVRDPWGVFILIIIIIIMASALLPDPPIKSRPAPTEREKSEAGVQAILRKYGPDDQSEEEIRQGAKDVMDEWDRVTK